MSTFTPRRSTRGQIFTPSPHPESSLQPKNVIFGWTSAPLPSSLSLPDSLDPEGKRTYYNSFTRITTKHRRAEPLATPGKRPKAGKGDEESRFTVGDGVLVKVEGNADGVGVLVRLWEEPEEKDEEDEGSVEETSGSNTRADELGEEGETGEGGKRMMAEVHWCFRREDLPGIMKNLTVEDVSIMDGFLTTSCAHDRERQKLTSERSSTSHVPHPAHHDLSTPVPLGKDRPDILLAILQVPIRPYKIRRERVAIRSNGYLLVCAGIR